MNDQIVELSNPGLMILFHSPSAARQMEEGGDYRTHFPDGRDIVDQLNAGRFGAFGTRFPDADYWLHFSSTMDHSVIARASDHVMFGLEGDADQLCVRAGDDLFSWRGQCPGEQLISIESGVYAVTACMLPVGGDGPIRIYMHFAHTFAKPELGYDRVPELYCESPVL
jgi:hypothetical protein